MKISLISFKEIMERLIFNECYSIACTCKDEEFQKNFLIENDVTKARMRTISPTCIQLSRQIFLLIKQCFYVSPYSFNFIA